MSDLVWKLLGEEVTNYVEPFAGSLAVLLARPGGPGKIETVNDFDGLLANAWRAVSVAPDEVAMHADWPVNEADLHARHIWLVGQREGLTSRLMGDPDWFDVKAAGWWIWGACAWIGSGWCSGQGPWVSVDGELVDHRQLPHLSAGQGINRKLPHLSAGQGINRQGEGIREMFAELGARLRRVRVACGDFERVLGPTVTWRHGTTGVFLDPPYDAGNHDPYASNGSGVSARAREWAKANWWDSRLKIVLAGYAGEHDELELLGFRRYEWKASGGYGSQGDGRGRANAARECLWASPSCNLDEAVK